MRTRLPKFVGRSSDKSSNRDQAARLGELCRAGNAARDRKDWATAAKYYAEVVAKDGSALDIAVQLGHAHKEMGDLERAARLYYAVLGESPEDDDLHLQIGHLEKLRNNVAKAIEHYKTAAQLNPKNLDARREYHALQGWGASGGNIQAGEPGELRWPGALASSAAQAGSPTGNGSASSVAAPKSSVANRFGQLSTPALRDAGDRARDARLWAEAAPAYLAYLERVPSDAAIWVQFGHCLKETGDLAGGESAYLRALAQQPLEADLHLQLGHVLKLQGRSREAAEAYRRSFALKPLTAAAFELQHLGIDLAVEQECLAPESRAPELFFEISDLFVDLLDNGTISGIQRVQLGIISHILAEHDRGRALNCRVVIWEGDDLWAPQPNALIAFLRIYQTAGEAKPGRRRETVDSARNNAELVRPVPGDIVVSTGTIFRRSDLVKADARLKRAGVRLGAYIHDFIPLTHPEFCHRGQTDEFAPTMADALLHRDFALTASEHVKQEFGRLLTQAGYPMIPIRAVPEAHSLTVGPGVAEDDWTPTIAAVRGREFVLCVGTLSAQKNQVLLLQIWQLLLHEGIEPPILVLVGRRGHNIADLSSQLATTNKLHGRVHVFEGLADSELQTLYRNCLFTMFPSFVEGWGLPVGESLAYGKVCIASNAASLPEVGGDFVIYIDPYNARGAAELVRRLLDDRAELDRLEARIRNEFRPRSWQEHGAALIRAVEELGRAEVPQKNRPRPIAMPFGKVVRAFRIDTGWEYGTVLPPRQILADRALRRLLLERGWYPTESWGTWMKGHHGQIGFTIEGEPANRVRVVLQFRAAPWAQGNRLTIRAACAAGTTVTIPESRRALETFPHFLAWLDCVPDNAGRIELAIEILGAIPKPWWEERRQYCVGLTRLICLRDGETDERAPPHRMIRPAALSGPTGTAIVPRGSASLVAAMKRRAMLAEGWREPEAWGTWMAGRTAQLVLATETAPGKAVSVALQLRAPAARHTLIKARSECGATAGLRRSAVDPCDFPLWLDCRVGADGTLRLTLDVDSRPANAAADLQAPVLGIAGIAYGRGGSASDRLALAEALLFAQPDEREDEACRQALERDLRFSVIGHVNGTYSLAATNRRLALALEGAWPDAVRVDQVEGQPVRDLAQVPTAERLAIAALAARERHEDGFEVELVHHWPVWPPPHPAALKLAHVPWEESVAPRDMVRVINEKYHGVVVQTRFVAKALIDSGVRLPIRWIGCAIDLDAYAALGAERAGVPASPRPTAPAPFVFLHVSSCLPRKGVDVLITAYARAFRRTDAVRLVIKGFENEHNDVPERIARLHGLDPGAPEILMVNRDLPSEQLVELYRQADAMVLPTRGEGLNMPAAEALAAGLPLIVTGYSGQTDFAGADVARQVDFRFAPSRSHLHSPGSVWAEPVVDDLAAALREIFDAAGDPTARRELAERVERGRLAVQPLADGPRWAARVKDVAIELLALGPLDKPVAPTVAWVTSWNVRCGVATYSKYLLDRYPNAARDVIVLCDESTRPEDLNVTGAPAARYGWRWAEPEAVDRLAGEIAATGARAVVIQHQPGLIGWDKLALLLRDDRLAGRETVLVLHTLLELLGLPERDAVLDQFRRVSRVLVHNVRELNLLRTHGLVDNVTLFPHGTMRPTGQRPTMRELSKSVAPVIGTYGFILPDKGVDVLIEAVGLVRAEWPGARLCMVTAEYPREESAAEIARCQALAQSLGLEAAVEWHTEYLPDEGSLALLAGCDLVVLPRRETAESASGSARVAMASRVPVLVTPVAMFDEIGDAVIRAQGLDAPALAAGIGAALRDRGLRERTLEEADRWLEAHDWAGVSERLFGMICGLVANREAFAPAIAAPTIAATVDSAERSAGTASRESRAAPAAARPARDSPVVPTSAAAGTAGAAASAGASTAD